MQIPNGFAKKLNCADKYIELSREDPNKQWKAFEGTISIRI
jgi:hypothetical protein